MAFDGVFGTIDGAEAVVLGRSFDGDAPAEGTAVGSRFPLAETLVPELLAASGAVCFDDLRANGLLDARRCTRASGARSAIGIAFRAGAKTYYLRFTADRSMSDPFDDVDRAYIELIAKIIAQRLRQQQQLERLRFAMEHDLLTELPNRAKLRAAIGAALETQPAGALIALDLDRFRDLVIALSRQTADAVLVEVAIALRSRLRPGELLGRTGGDVFAVYVPGAERAAAFERARALIERFREPFGTGDRDGMELVRVTASVGVALLPGDASTVDELFARAETAVDLAKAAGRDQIAFYFRPGSTPLVPSP
jgi:diguanylate cyclase (GGDEF)-like protein